MNQNHNRRPKRFRLSSILCILAGLVPVCVFLFSIMASCGLAPLSVPANIRYDGTTITWDAVDKAAKYSVTINNNAAVSTAGTVYAYSNPSDADFTVSVKAVNEKGKESEAGVITFKALGRIADLKLDAAAKLTWSPVDMAGGYSLWIDGKEQTVNLTEFSGFSAGKHTVKVKASCDILDETVKYYARYTEPLTFTVCADVSEKTITYDSSLGLIRWEAVPGAVGYDISVSGADGDILETVNGTSFAYDSHFSAFDATIRAIGNHSDTYDSTNSVTRKFIYLDTVKNVRMDSGVLYWDAVDNATGYTIRLNGKTLVNVTDCSYANIPVNTSVDVEIMPVSSDSCYFSSWSIRESYLILPSPVIRWVGDHDGFNGGEISSVYWDAVDSANGYTVRMVYENPEGVKDKPVETVLGTANVGFAYDFTAVGAYYIDVKSNNRQGDANSCDSRYSNQIKVIRLPAPTIRTSSITSTSDSLKDGFTAAFNGVTGATEYRVQKNHTDYQTVTTTQFHEYQVCGEDVTVETVIDYSVSSIGRNAYDSNGVTVVTLDSLPEAAADFTIKVLAVPVVADMSGFAYSWSEVSGAYGYMIKTDSSSHAADALSHDLSYLTAGTHKVSMCARGNGADVLASNYTPEIEIYRLSAPYDIHVKTEGASEGVLAFSSDAGMGGSGYEMFIDGSKTAIPVDEYTNMKQYITTAGTDIYLRASANVYNASRTVYIMSSEYSQTLHIRKLAAPTFGKTAFTNNQFIWNPSSEAAAYEVYNNQEILYGTYTGTSMELADLRGGTSYTFMLKAIGNGTTTFNSDYSAQQTIYKLETPKVTQYNGGYKWQAVSDASGYAVYVDGKLSDTALHVSGSEYSFAPRFSELKTYHVEVYAVGDGGIRTINSSAFALDQKTKQLETPDFSFGYSHDAFTKNGEIIMTIIKDSPYASGYAYSVGGVVNNSADLTFRFNPNGTGDYALKVTALGGGFDNDGVYYLDSQSVGGNSSYTIHLLNSVDASSITLSRDGRLTWTAVKNAGQYYVTIAYNGGTASKLVNTASFNMNEVTDFKNVTYLNISVQAVGGQNSVSSSVTTREWAVVSH